MEQLLDKICHHDDQDTSEILRQTKPCQSATENSSGGSNSTNCERTLLLLKRLKARDEDLRLAAEIGQAIVHKYDDSLLENAKVSAELAERTLQLTTAEERATNAEELVRQLTVENAHWKQRSVDSMDALRALEQRYQEATDRLNESSRLSLERRRSSITTATSPLTPEEQHQIMEDVTAKDVIISELRAELERLRSEKRLLLSSQDPGQSARQQSGLVDQLTAERDRLHKSLQSALDEKTELESRLGDFDGLTAAVRELSQLNERLTADNQEQKRLLADTQQELTELKESTMILSGADESSCEFDQPSFMLADSPFVERSPVFIKKQQQQQQERPASSKRPPTAIGPNELGAFDDAVRASSSVFGELESYLQASLRKSASALVFPIHEAAVETSSSYLQETPTKQQQPLALNDTTNCTQQLQLLCSLASQLHQRLSSSSTVSLNRRLRRAFDARELTTLSNSIIDNILHDVDAMSGRFNSSSTTNTTGNSGDIIKTLNALARLISGLLRDLGRQRKTLNEYSLAYVNKMEEWSRREVEERRERQRLRDVEQQQQLSRQTSISSLASLSDRLRRSLTTVYHGGSPLQSHRRVSSERTIQAGPIAQQTPPSPSPVSPSAAQRSSGNLRPTQSVYVPRERRRVIAATTVSPHQSSPLRRVPHSSSRMHGHDLAMEGESIGWRHGNSSGSSGDGSRPTDTASVTPAPSAEEDHGRQTTAKQQHHQQRQDCVIQ